MTTSSAFLFKTGVKEFELRRTYLYLHPAQFDKLLGNLTTGAEIRFYIQQGVQIRVRPDS